MSSVPPGLLLLGGALLALCIPARLRPATVLAAAVLTAAQIVLALEPGATVELQWLGFTIIPLRVDRLSLAFGYVFAIITVLGAAYAFHVRSRTFHAASLTYAGAALGAVFAGDLLTLMLAWEVMALASAMLVMTGGFPGSPGAGARYLYVHLAGGTALLAGILWHVAAGGSLAFEAFAGGPAAWLILLGFAVNAAIPPLHAWLADAYPEASVPGTVFLSAFTTKTAVYVLARGFPGWEILVPAGVVMALYGVVYAVLENDIRRLLAYHIISQVGFMVAAVGIGTQSAINGATAHAFAHVLYKGLLLMAAGAVLHARGTARISELGGLTSTSMRAVFVLFLIGALSISGFPLFSGFVGKSLVTYAAEADHRLWVVFLLYGASVGTFMSIGLKLSYFTWFGRRPQDVARERRAPSGMYVAMAAAAFSNIAIGVYPRLLYAHLPYPVSYEPYTAGHVIQTLELLAFTALGFWLLVEKLRPAAGISVDTDWFYRQADRPARQLVLEPVAAVFTRAQAITDQSLRALTDLVSGQGPASLLARPLPLGGAISLVLVVAGLTIVGTVLR